MLESKVDFGGRWIFTIVSGFVVIVEDAADTGKELDGGLAVALVPITPRINTSCSSEAATLRGRPAVKVLLTGIIKPPLWAYLIVDDDAVLDDSGDLANLSWI